MKETVIKPQIIILIIAAFIILTGAGIGAFKYRQLARELSDLKTNPTKVQDQTRQEQLDLLLKVDKLINLPKDEEPTVATVTDVERVRDQPFFANAKNGDKVIIFTKARKAILFREETNKIINFSSINIATESAQTVSPSIPVPTLLRKPLPTPIRIPVSSVSATPGE